MIFKPTPTVTVFTGVAIAAPIECLGTAKMALPNDVLVTMFKAVKHAASNRFNSASLTH